MGKISSGILRLINWEGKMKVKELMEILKKCKDDEEVMLVEEIGREFKEYELHRLRGFDSKSNVNWFTIKQSI